MSLYKTDRITTLPHLMNTNKSKIYNDYFNNLLIAKNRISEKRLKDKELQYMIFRYNFLSKEEKSYISRKNKEYQEDNKVLTKWELQKFFNQDYIDKKQNRYEQRIDNFHYKLFTLENRNVKIKVKLTSDELENNKNKKKKYKIILKKEYFNKQKPKSILGLYVEYKIKNEYYISKYYKENLEKIELKLIQKNSKFLEKHKDRIENLIKSIVDKIKYKKYPINYTTPSIIKSGLSGLGQDTFRIAKDLENSKYQYYYRLDTYDLNGEKEIIKIPLRYNETYHKDFKQYRLTSNNKFVKGKEKNKLKEDINLIKNIEIKKIKKEKETIKLVKSIKNGIEVESKIISLYEKEHCISFSKNSERLTINLIKNDERIYEKQSITEDNLIGIDVGGNIKNSIVDSNNKVLSFKFLKKIIKELNIIDKIDNTTLEGKELKRIKLGKITRKIEGNLNDLIKTYLDKCKEKGINHLAFEQLNSWNLKGKSKENNEKLNRVFRLIRRTGLVNLFRKQRRNKNIHIHTIPSYYTSKLCNKCKSHIMEDKNINKKNRTICCPNCGNVEDRDFNRAKNMKDILGRFPNELCSLDNKYYEFNRKKYLKKEFVKNTLLSFNLIKQIR